MALPSFARTAVTIKRPRVIVERGVEVMDTTDPVAHVVKGCSIQFRDTDTTLDQRTAVTVRAVIYFPPSADVKAGDMVVYDGVEYKIDGAPLRIESPTGRMSHKKATLVDWEG